MFIKTSFGIKPKERASFCRIAPWKQSLYLCKTDKDTFVKNIVNSSPL